MWPFLKKERQVDPKSVKELQQAFQQMSSQIKELKESLQKFQKKSASFTQKAAIVRYNPFDDQGGDQSFSIALLDADNNGIVLSSLYHKGQCQVYAKPITAGKSQYQLSDEEKKVLEQAINKNANQ